MNNVEGSNESSGHGEKFSRLKEQAIAALLVSPTIKEAAAKVGTGEATLRRWMRRPDFRHDYDQARYDVLQGATVELSTTVAEAIKYLRNTLRFPLSTNKLAVSKIILDLYGREMARYSAGENADRRTRNSAMKVSDRDAEYNPEEGLYHGDGAEDDEAEAWDGSMGDETIGSGVASSAAEVSQVKAEGADGPNNGALESGNDEVIEHIPEKGSSGYVLKRRKKPRPDGARYMTPSATSEKSSAAKTQMIADERFDDGSDEVRVEDIRSKQRELHDLLETMAGYKI